MTADDFFDQPPVKKFTEDDKLIKSEESPLPRSLMPKASQEFLSEDSPNREVEEINIPPTEPEMQDNEQNMVSKIGNVSSNKNAASTNSITEEEMLETAEQILS